MKKLLISLLFSLSACATVRQDYDDTYVAPTEAGTFVPVTIRNYRVRELAAPTFYLASMGRHSLGTVGGPDGVLRRLVDTRWFNSDGCTTISVHYVGEGDLSYWRFCWRPGYVIDVSLDNTFNPGAAWAHP